MKNYITSDKIIFGLSDEAKEQLQDNLTAKKIILEVYYEMPRKNLKPGLGVDWDVFLNDLKAIHDLDCDKNKSKITNRFIYLKKNSTLFNHASFSAKIKQISILHIAAGLMILLILTNGADLKTFTGLAYEEMTEKVENEQLKLYMFKIFLKILHQAKNLYQGSWLNFISLTFFKRYYNLNNNDDSTLMLKEEKKILEKDFKNSDLFNVKQISAFLGKEKRIKPISKASEEGDTLKTFFECCFYLFKLLELASKTKLKRKNVSQSLSEMRPQQIKKFKRLQICENFVNLKTYVPTRIYALTSMLTYYNKSSEFFDKINNLSETSRIPEKIIKDFKLTAQNLNSTIPGAGNYIDMAAKSWKNYSKNLSLCGNKFYMLEKKKYNRILESESEINSDSNSSSNSCLNSKSISRSISSKSYESYQSMSIIEEKNNDQIKQISIANNLNHFDDLNTQIRNKNKPLKNLNPQNKNFYEFAENFENNLEKKTNKEHELDIEIPSRRLSSKNINCKSSVKEKSSSHKIDIENSSKNFNPESANEINIDPMLNIDDNLETIKSNLAKDFNNFGLNDPTDIVKFFDRETIIEYLNPSKNLNMNFELKKNLTTEEKAALLVLNSTLNKTIIPVRTDFIQKLPKIFTNHNIESSPDLIMLTESIEYFNKVNTGNENNERNEKSEKKRKITSKKSKKRKTKKKKKSKPMKPRSRNN